MRKQKITIDTITGDTALDDRQRIVDDFQIGKIQVIVGSIRACGMGLNLTRTSNVIFGELDWTPAMISQAEDRTHRIGQKNAVLSQLVVFDDSIDAMLAKKIVEKEKMIESIFE